MTVPIALDHLTLLDASPPEFVTLAADAGFSAVGLRIRPIDPSEDRWPLDIGSAMLTETLSLLADTGLTVSQIETVFLDEHLDVASLARELEIGAALGAPLLYVVPADDDLDRFADRFAEIDRLAAPYGIRPAVEPMAYRPVRNLSMALEVVERSENGGIVTDSLHFFRAGDTLEQLREIDPRRIPVVQLCDARADPNMVPRDVVAARGQSSDVPPLQWEARVGRLLPGEGVLPLEDYVRAVPPGATIALEAPNASQIAELGAAAFLARGAAAMRELLAAAGR